MQRNGDEDSGRSSCSAASIGLSPIIGEKMADLKYMAVQNNQYSRHQNNSNELKVSVRPRSCLSLLKSPDEKDPFPSKYARNDSRKVLSIFDTPRKGGLTNAHSTIDIASSTRLELPKMSKDAAVSLTFVSNDKPTESNFKRRKPVQRAASRLYKADIVKGHKSACTGPEFIVRAAQPPKTLDLTLSALTEKRIVTVVLLNGQKIDVLCDPATITCGQLFEAIVLRENYEQNFMLGLAVLLGGDFIFLPDDYKIKKIAPENWYGTKKKNARDFINFTVFMRIKFFLPTNIARNVQDGEWRYRVYLQLRRSTVEGQLTSTLQNLILLTGYALHIEFGEFNFREHGTADYFLLEHYLPENAITNDMFDIKLRIKRAHESRRGLSRSNAIVNYITLAQTFRDYGSHFYSAVWATRDGFCRDVWLSIGPRGIALYSRDSRKADPESCNMRIVLQSLPWHHIHTFYYNKKSLHVMPNSNSGLSKIGMKYKLKMTDNKSYFAFWLASLHHRLYVRLYARDDFINYLSGEPSIFMKPVSSPNIAQCSNYQDSYNLAVRNNPIRLRKPVRRKFKIDIFGEKKNQNKENEKPNTEELLKQILIHNESILNTSPRSNTQGNSSNDGLSSSESCSLPRRHGVKMGTRVFQGVVRSPVSTMSKGSRTEDLATTQSDSDDLASTTGPRSQHCDVDSMKLLPERPYINNARQSPTAFVLESPKVYSDVFNFDSTNNESCLNMSLLQKLDKIGCVQGERVFVTTTIQRDSNKTLGIQVAEGSDGNVYIKSITVGGPADYSQKLQPGDQIISVNGQTLLNVKYDKALTMLQSAPDKVELIVLQNIDKSTNLNTPSLECRKNIMQSIASGLEDIEITDDELLNEEALKTIYALIKLTKEKVISRIKDKEQSQMLQKSQSVNRVFDETDAGVFSSQENTPEKRNNQKFNTWRSPQGQRPKRRPLSLSIPSEKVPDDYLNMTTDLLKKSSLNSVQSSLTCLDKKSETNKGVALPRAFGLGRRWLGPVRYPVTPCKSNTNVSAINDVVKRRFVYGADESDDEQIFL